MISLLLKKSNKIIYKLCLYLDELIKQNLLSFILIISFNKVSVENSPGEYNSKSYFSVKEYPLLDISITLILG